MNPIGLGILAFIAYFGYRGFQRGLIDEVGRLVGLVLALILANRFASLIAGQLNLDSETAQRVVAFVIIFVITLIAMGFVVRLVRTLVELVLLGWLDRLGGILFGMLKSLVVFGVLVYIVENFEISRPFITRLEQQSLIFRQVDGLKNGLFSAFSLDSLIQDAYEQIRGLEPELLQPLIED